MEIVHLESSQFNVNFLAYILSEHSLVFFRKTAATLLLFDKIVSQCLRWQNEAKE